MRNNLLLQLVENAQDGVVVSEKEGDDTILIYVNPAFEKLTGYSADEILYQDCRFLQGDDRKQQAVEQIRQAIDKKEPLRTIIKNYRKDGSAFWNELSITPFFDEVDELEYFIGIQKDVSEEVVLKEKLAQAESKIALLEAELATLKNA
ncbi:PAS domain-containing protein [Thiomicrorhabdus sediminis]|uniref:PAS domain-containing protein n=1 Tax=Thiomicrorhabdus sediminis TaxID=2580412 RepID=A0A4P9K9G4_9GAMM|nr:PAS domain-containing protein [Thiomicrorhabdus sediminis]